MDTHHPSSVKPRRVTQSLACWALVLICALRAAHGLTCLPNVRCCDDGLYVGTTLLTCPGFDTVPPASDPPCCVKCGLGEYSNAFTNGVCQPCGPGTSNPSYGSTCDPCGLGEYQNESGTRFCKKCPAGTSTSSVGSQKASDCVPCAAGYFSAGGTACKQCPANTFSSTTGAASCTACPVGFRSDPGSTSCVLCDNGYYQPSGTNICCRNDLVAAPSATSCSVFTSINNALVSRQFAPANPPHGTIIRVLAAWDVSRAYDSLERLGSSSDRLVTAPVNSAAPYDQFFMVMWVGGNDILLKHILEDRCLTTQWNNGNLNWKPGDCPNDNNGAFPKGYRFQFWQKNDDAVWVLRSLFNNRVNSCVTNSRIDWIGQGPYLSGQECSGDNTRQLVRISNIVPWSGDVITAGRVIRFSLPKRSASASGTNPVCFDSMEWVQECDASASAGCALLKSIGDRLFGYECNDTPAQLFRLIAVAGSRHLFQLGNTERPKCLTADEPGNMLRMIPCDANNVYQRFSIQRMLNNKFQLQYQFKAVAPINYWRCVRQDPNPAPYLSGSFAAKSGSSMVFGKCEDEFNTWATLKFY